MLNSVTTFDGTLAKQKDCRKIKGEFYKKGEQCILIREKWYRINSGYIEKDCETGIWYLTNELPNVIKGIVKWNDGPIYGKFSPNLKKNISVYHRYSESLETALSEDVLKGSKYTLRDGIYWIETRTNSRISNEQLYGFHLPYRTKDIPNYIKRLYTPKPSSPDFIKKYSGNIKSLLRYTWGVEIETSTGRLDLKDCINNNLFPLRDGSISGIEYTTPVINSVDSFYTLKEGLDRLRVTSHDINEQCSLHVHVGGITEDEISKLYKLLIKIEKHIYEMFPPSYIKTSIFKRRDYNNPLKRFPNITNEEIFRYLCEGRLEYGFYSSHPLDPGNNRKWDVQQRYSIENFIPYFFSDAKTVEFRIHTPTLNFDKILLWMMFINSILYWIRYSDKGCESVRQMVTYCYPSEMGNKLYKYLSLRKKWYGKKNRDRFGLGEIYMDDRFSIDKL